ncbi:MAG: flavodoxin family protein [Deltaproteobacteria bacterium]|uniref:Flavodoxin family protein n=1 Tax=Candidatus Zymogenus saltonus TaxID=2844893 RepID=A0A9D8KI36_9DELT|nr:flavodoxin family protein [Candidatus Zymogenus saltonus]
MRVLYISGSPRKNGNTDYLLKLCQSITGGDFIRLSDYQIEYCSYCGACIEKGVCTIEDDMTKIAEKLLKSQVIVLGSPVFFNNVSGQMKVFMDRTWPLRGNLKNKIGGALVVGRKYGLESAINAINSFFLKHDMIVANRGVTAIAFDIGKVKEDGEAIESTEKLAKRIQELNKFFS